MTHQQFAEYCAQNKSEWIVPNEFEGFKIFFENEEYIEARGGIDGIIYTHVSEELKTDNKQLLKDLQAQVPDFLPHLIQKYGDIECDPISGILWKGGKKIYDVMDNSKKE